MDWFSVKTKQGTSEMFSAHLKYFTLSIGLLSRGAGPVTGIHKFFGKRFNISYEYAPKLKEDPGQGTAGAGRLDGPVPTGYERSRDSPWRTIGCMT